MITSQALQELLNNACQQAALKAAQRIPGYDLPKVQSHLQMMSKENLLGWKTSEVMATLEMRTTSGCPDPDDAETIQTMQNCFQEAVRDITKPSEG